MPYCKTALLITHHHDVLATLSVFARENFAFGQAAYKIGEERYAIDGGENDIRAIHDKENNTVKFFCRYSDDISKYEKILTRFAQKHKISIINLPIDKSDILNAECDACKKPHVDVRTEVVAADPNKPNTIKKRIIFRCEDHIDCDTDEMERLALIKAQSSKHGPPK
ncbi:MAG: hypothetical protein Alis2KO_41860 [Aliiglaciecola sp.]